MSKILISPEEIQHRYSIHSDNLRHLIRIGELRPIQWGLQTLFFFDDVDLQISNLLVEAGMQRMSKFRAME